MELDWTSDLACHPAGPAFAAYDIIVGSDVAYDEDLFKPLLDTITAFTACKPSTRVCCWQEDPCKSCACSACRP